MPAGYFLDGNELKNPKSFKEEYIFQKTDFTAINGKVTRDISHRKEKYFLEYQNLSVERVATLLAIIAKNTSVLFTVEESDKINISKNVFPYIGSIEYSKIGNNYLASLILELIEEE